VEFKGKSHTWKGKNITISVNEYGHKITEGMVFVTTKTLDESREAERRKKASSAVDNL
jgi:hypothetical protein